MLLIFFLQWTTEMLFHTCVSSSNDVHVQPVLILKGQMLPLTTHMCVTVLTWPWRPPEKEEKAACTVQRCRSSVLLCVFLNFKIMMRFTYLKWGSSQYYTTATNKQSSWPFFLCMTVNRTLVFTCFYLFFGVFLFIWVDFLLNAGILDLSLSIFAAF